MGSDLFDLTGKVALITGATQGSASRWRAVWRRPAPGWSSCAESRETRESRDCTHTGGTEDLRQLLRSAETGANSGGVQEIERECGRIDILVNNAGIQRRTPLEQFDEAVWREVLDTNLTAVFLVTKQVVQGMIARKSGKIINICSLMCEASRPTVAAYTAAKGGVKQLTKSMAVEWAKHNIQTNGIGPLHRHGDESAID